jgi:hypothetical protein
MRNYIHACAKGCMKHFGPVFSEPRLNMGVDDADQAASEQASQHNTADPAALAPAEVITNTRTYML